MGEWDRCPIGAIKENQELISLIFNEYKGLKRFGVRCDPSIPLPYLIAVDEEVDKIRQQELERERTIENARRKGAKCR